MGRLRRTLSWWPLVLTPGAFMLLMAGGFSIESAFFAGFLVPTLGLIYRKVRRFKLFSTKTSALAVKVNEGDEGAIVPLEELAKKHRGSPTAYSFALYNLAQCEILAGNPTRALSLFAALKKSPGHKRLRHVLPYKIATAHALLGDVAAAQEWLDEGDQKNEFEHLRVDTLARSIIRCRRHDYVLAARFLDDEWSRIDALYTGKFRHAHAVIRAFALIESGVSAQDEIVQALIISARLSKKTFSFLGAHWNEMHAFLAEHSLLEND